MDNWQLLAERIDSFRMIDLLESFPEQLTEAERLGREFEFRQPDIPIKQLVFVGMGGSALAGDVIRALVEDRTSVSVQVHRAYTLPAWVGHETLVAALSHSGNTEETLFAFREAQDRHAKLLAVTSGGQLASFCQQEKIPYIRIPGGRPPRTALGYLFFPLFLVLVQNSFFDRVTGELEELHHLVAEKAQLFALEVPEENNPAKQWARKLHGKVPVFYASGKLGVAALRWKAQLNENAKQHAFWNILPEMNHNEIVGWELQGQKKLRSTFQPIFLHNTNDHPQIQKRMAISERTLQKSGLEVLHIETEGDTELARLFSIILLADFTSYYMALLNGIDPTPIAVIDELKSKLQKEE